MDITARRLPGIRPILVVLLITMPRVAAGQLRVPITVVDSVSRNPVVGARITLRDAAGRAAWNGSTDSAGSAIATIPEGSWTADLQALGYTALETRAEITTEAPLRFALAPAPVEVGGVAVDARARRASTVLERSGFNERRGRKRFGHYIDHLEIEERNVFTVSEIMRRMTGVRIEPSGAGAPIVYMRAGDRPDRNGQIVICGPRVLRDGVTVHTGGRGNPVRIDDIVQADDIAGMEVYRSASEVPTAFAGGQNGCGLIVIWTR